MWWWWWWWFLFGGGGGGVLGLSTVKNFNYTDVCRFFLVEMEIYIISFDMPFKITMISKLVTSLSHHNTMLY